MPEEETGPQNMFHLSYYGKDYEMYCDRVDDVSDWVSAIDRLKRRKEHVSTSVGSREVMMTLSLSLSFSLSLSSHTPFLPAVDAFGKAYPKSYEWDSSQIHRVLYRVGDAS
jgi:hypothetical protein